MDGGYTPPLALTVVSGVFLILGAICFLIVAGDIILRKGWRSMMGVMVPVYPINAAYMLPVTLYVYFKYGRAAKPVSKSQQLDNEAKQSHCHMASKPAAVGSDESDDEVKQKSCHMSSNQAPVANTEAKTGGCHMSKPEESKGCCKKSAPPADHCKSQQLSTQNSQSQSEASVKPHPCHADPEKGLSQQEQAEDAGACHHHDASRPMIITLLVGVSHCGAGCVLGDLVGEWLVYGTGAKINGHMIWAELLIDYAFALLFGIAFQYFSIAPMSGEYGPKTVWRAAKADILSLTSFEVGAFGWMIIYQVGIFNYKLSMDTYLYWWMMQIGMAFGFATAIPMNYFLITRHIKEPCC